MIFMAVVAILVTLSLATHGHFSLWIYNLFYPVTGV